MIYVLGILFFLLAFLLICVILLQEGKGGGLAAMSGAVTDSVMGAKNPLRRMTVYFFVCFIAIVIGLNYYINKQNDASIDTGLVPVTLDEVKTAPEKTEETAPEKPAENAAETTPAEKPAEAAAPAEQK